MDVSIFEIIGPVMIGPSSSHTAGMARIGKMARSIAGIDFESIEITFHVTIKDTYEGHKSDVAVIGGLLGIREDDEKIKDAREVASKNGIKTTVGFLTSPDKNPNTAIVKLGNKNSTIEITGISVGGGSFKIIEVDGNEVNFIGNHSYLFVNYLNGNTKDEIRNILNSSKAFTKSELGSGVIKINDGYFFWSNFTENLPKELLLKIKGIKDVTGARVAPPILDIGGTEQFKKPFYTSISEMLSLVPKFGSLAEVVLKYESERSGRSSGEILGLMTTYFKVMEKAVNRGLKEEISLLTGLTSGVDGKLLMESIVAGNTISGDTVPAAIARALAVMEVNGSMGTVVAAPTAGSCGIVPGCLLTLKEKKGLSDADVVRALIVAAGIGVNFVHEGASFSGVVGGCQGEVGVSSALAAAGLVEIAGGTPKQVAQAAALAMKNLLGLVCDPIGGPVEVPCIKRNAVGVANAFAAADMALAGIVSVIPADEVILALKNVQELLPCELKGTAIGGLACTPTAKRFREQNSLLA